MLKINQNTLDEIFKQVREIYPHECCGLLVGKSTEDKEVLEYRKIPNTNTERAQDRYVMDPQVWNQVDKELRQSQKEIIGIVHSHPDHSSCPSEFDRKHAWPIYSYMIVACEKGEKAQAQSWVINEETGQFEEEEISLI